MRATAGPALLDALFDFAVAALGSSVEVIDGYAPSSSPGDAIQLTIGASDPLDPGAYPAITSRQDRLEGYGGDRQEVIEVRCRLTTYPTDTLKGSRDVLAAVLTDLDEAMRADRSLGGVVTDSRLGSDLSLFQADGPAGDRIRFEFTIIADVYL